jgi:ATP-dependent RNA helicase MRH4
VIDPDFQEETRLLLEDISAARGHPIDTPLLSSNPSLSPQPQAGPLNYPFNLLLSSATISSALASYLDTYHPSLVRLASPNLHHLPEGLAPEYVSWTGGNRNADVEKKIKRVWAEDNNKVGKGDRRSKVLVFCNKNSKVDDLSKYLTEKGISSIALTSTSDARKRGSNHHLRGFLKTPIKDGDTSQDERDVTSGADVMITTSLLSRGLDFSPIVKHVFIVDEPRNMVDFLHRAGRTGRAGQSGKVVVFGKLKGRQSGKAREMKKRVSAVAN